MNGVVCIDKPYGCTSFDVVFNLKKILKIKKIGHSGTLDPIATGVLPIFVGKATKAIQFLSDTEKTYIAGFKLGEITDTFDCTGNLLEKNISNVTLNEINVAICEFKGKIVQNPPKFSAVKINGVPAYKLARRGEDFKTKARVVNVFEIYCTEFDEYVQEGKMLIRCSSGTYVRSICSDLGLKLGVGCVMTSLVRTRSCGFSLKCCHSIEEVNLAKLEGKLSDVFYNLEHIFRNFKKKHVNFSDKVKVLNGAPIKLENEEQFQLGELVVVLFKNEILGITRHKNNVLFVEKLFV